MDGWVWIAFGAAFTIWLAVMSYETLRQRRWMAGGLTGAGSVFMLAFTIRLLLIPGFI